MKKNAEMDYMLAERKEERKKNTFELITNCLDWEGKKCLVIFLLAFIYYHHPSLPNVINMRPREQRIITFYQDQHDNDKHCEQLIGRCLKERAHCGLSIGCCQRKDFLLGIDWAV